MLLSIIVAVYDGNFRYFQACLDSIKKNVKVPYEVLITDNCEKENIKNINTYDFSVFKRNYLIKENTGIMSPQLLVGIKARGKYIWFIDGDDTVNEVIEDYFSSDADIIEFGTQLDKEKQIYKSSKDIINYALWTKFIKTTCFIHNFYIRTNARIICNIFLIYHSDTLISISFNNISIRYFLNKLPYNYRGNNFSKENNTSRIPLLLKQIKSIEKFALPKIYYIARQSLSTIIKIICSTSDNIDLYVSQHSNEILDIKNIIYNKNINIYNNIDDLSQLLFNMSYYNWNDGLKLNYTLDSIKYFLTKIGIN